MVEFKKGLEVVIVKSLASKNRNDPGRSYQYYYASTGDINGIPLNSEGVITNTKEDMIWVKIKEKVYLFNKEELKISENNKNKMNISEVSTNNSLHSYVFSLATKTPVFVINDRLYVLGEEGNNLEQDFFQTTKQGKKTTHKLVESASLNSLEELAETHFFKEFEEFRNNYFKKVINEIEGTKVSENYPYEQNVKLVDFIVNKVFPHLRNKEQNDEKLENILGIKRVKNNISEVKENYVRNESLFITELIKKVSQQKFQTKKNKKRKTTKLDFILGFDQNSNVDVSKFPEDYKPNSILGKVLEGRNVAIINNEIYALIKTENNGDQSINISETNYSLVSPISLDLVKAKFSFELERKLMLETLKVKVAESKKVNEILGRDSKIKELLEKTIYEEEDFGFMKEGNHYYVFLKVPEHVLKMPDDYVYFNGQRNKDKNKYYRFGETKIGVRIFFDGLNTSEGQPRLLDNYTHPFTGGMNQHVCLGNYNYTATYMLEQGLNVVTLLKDTRRTMLSGYVSGGTKPINPLERFEHKRISLEEIKKLKLPITNINLKKNKPKK
ncbi:hypothetical protein HZA97_08710 [Candidatus Woesearchaeota archaeon]|nr:hypothetical protein [Candidatus Woesearchaeota archaeon]